MLLLVDCMLLLTLLLLTAADFRLIHWLLLPAAAV
jgi:hypothetical protein